MIRQYSVNAFGTLKGVQMDDGSFVQLGLKKDEFEVTRYLLGCEVEGSETNRVYTDEWFVINYVIDNRPVMPLVSQLMGIYFGDGIYNFREIADALTPFIIRFGIDSVDEFVAELLERACTDEVGDRYILASKITEDKYEIHWVRAEGWDLMSIPEFAGFHKTTLCDQMNRYRFGRAKMPFPPHESDDVFDDGFVIDDDFFDEEFFEEDLL